MEELSAAAGLTKGTLYHYFASKDELVTQMLHGVLDRESRVTKTALEGASSAVEQLRVMAQLSFSRQQHTQRIMKMVADAQRFLPEPMWQELFARFMAESHAPLETIMRFGIANGEFEPHDTTFSTWAFMGLLSQLADPQLQFSQPDTVDHLLEFVLRGIAKR
jgi:AcrR family transcriptional regulator